MTRTVNAAGFGLSVDADGETNRAALQAAVDAVEVLMLAWLLRTFGPVLVDSS